MARKLDLVRAAERPPEKLSPDQFAESVRPVVEAARHQGITSHHALADYLTERGIRTPMGKAIWDHDGAGRLLARLKRLNAREPPTETRSPAQARSRQAWSEAMSKTPTPKELAVHAARSQEAREFEESMREHLLAAVDAGVESDRKAAAYLNRKGMRTRMNQRWTAAAVARLRSRLGLPKMKVASSGRDGNWLARERRERT
jgi:hypothetical protein